MTKKTLGKCRCEGKGTYYDRRCNEEVCAHRGEKGKNGQRVRIMECPERTCLCRFGNEAKRRRAALEAEAIAAQFLPPELPALPPAQLQKTEGK